MLSLESAFESHVKVIREAIVKRNAIVHAVVDVGFSYVQFNDSREAVLIGISDNDKDKWESRLEETAELDPWETGEMVSWDISEVDLERQLAQAYKALDKCVDIWIGVKGCLPDPAGTP